MPKHFHGSGFAKVPKCQDGDSNGTWRKKRGPAAAKQTERRRTLKTLTSLNKEVRPFFLGDNSIWSFPSVSSLGDYSIIVPKYYYRLGKMEFKESSLLISRGLRSSREVTGLKARLPWRF